jgi:uncharacterized protein (TIGR03435 family)
MRAAALLAILSTAVAQTPQFEVASIKPSPPGATRGRMSGGPETDDPGMFSCENITLAALVITSFNLPNYRYSGPDWMRSVRFNIAAKIPPGTTKEQFFLMMQNLFADRFKLQFHWEKKEMQTYNLVVAKGGHKIKESIPGDSPVASQAAGPPKEDADGFPILPPGRKRILLEGGGGHVAMRWADETMDQLAYYLSAQLHTPVNNATGLTGKYDFTMRWISDSPGQPTTEETGPNLVRAVQEQLGLRLESKKGTIDILVVDHINRVPTEN